MPPKREREREKRLASVCGGWWWWWVVVGEVGGGRSVGVGISGAGTIAAGASVLQPGIGVATMLCPCVVRAWNRWTLQPLVTYTECGRYVIKFLIFFVLINGFPVRALVVLFFMCNSDCDMVPQGRC